MKTEISYRPAPHHRLAGIPIDVYRKQETPLLVRVHAAFGRLVAGTWQRLISSPKR